MIRLQTARVFWMLALGGLMLAPTAAQAQIIDPTHAVIYAGGDIQFLGFSNVTGGPVTALGDVRHHSASLNLHSLVTSGSFDGTGGFQNVLGDMVVGGNVTQLGGPGSTVGGSIRSGGHATLQGSIDIAGNISTSGDLEQIFNFSTVQGDVNVGGNASITGTVIGQVTHGGILTIGTFGSVGGSSSGGAVAAPSITVKPTPAPHTITAGGTDINLTTFEDRTLAPGRYGTLNFDSGNTVFLSAGQYFFDDVVSGFSLNELDFDTTGGPVEVFVVGDFVFDNLVQVINGEALFAGGNPVSADAADILLEATGSITLNSSLYATVFAPHGDITTATFADVTGSLIATGNVTIGSSADVSFVRSNVVPEPAALAMLCALGAWLSLKRRR